MKSFSLLSGLQFSQSRPVSQALLGDPHNRILRFCLSPNQTIPEHSSPHSSLVVVVLQGWGIFSTTDGAELKLGPNELLVFEPGEVHAVRALDQELVFLALLQGIGGHHEAVGVMAEP